MRHLLDLARRLRSMTRPLSDRDEFLRLVVENHRDLVEIRRRLAEKKAEAAKTGKPVANGSHA